MNHGSPRPHTRRSVVHRGTPKPTRAERHAAGKALREQCPRTAHAEWSPAVHRVDPVTQITTSSNGRIPELIPIRYGRMSPSPFTMYRGTANIMAADLATTPSTGIAVQACGDCHLLNFGVYASPERQAVFDINDFDETMPGPWEWDVKRLTVSFVLASRSNGLSGAAQRGAALATVRSYRTHMAGLAEMTPLEVWYSRIDVNQSLRAFTDRAAVARFRKRLAKTAAKTRDDRDSPMITERRNGRRVIEDNPPLIYHHPALKRKQYRTLLEGALADYRRTLPHERQVLFDRYEASDYALKVVGVGSVGLLAAVFLMVSPDDQALFLQVKQARPSVLAPFVGRGKFANDGQRIVEGQRLMQASSDIFLGWTAGAPGHHFYLRQLSAAKLKVRVETFGGSMMMQYGALCGRALARAHARSGDAATIAGYLGSKDTFDQAVATFAAAYADQVELDHAAFTAAIKKGKIKAQVER